MNKQGIIYQVCESCHDWHNQEELVWDLEEDRLVCKDCHDSIVVDIKKEVEDEFETPIWAHKYMRKMGLNPFSLEDWCEFCRYCE